MTETAEGRYNELSTARFAYWQRARDAARLTIPSLVPPLGATGATKFPTPWQSVGARGVNNVAAKLLLSLFPPNQPLFRLEISEFALEKTTGSADLKSEIDKALDKIEREVQTEIETTSIRPSAAEALKHLVVAGNVLTYVLPKGGMKVFHIGNYVVHRDPEGNVLEHIVKECMSPRALPAELKHLVKTESDKDGKSTEKNVDLYTWVQRKQNQWTVHQEINGKRVPGSQGTYPLDKSPWLPLRWSRVDGEDYGRGLVEEYQGDLQSLDGLTQSVVEGAAAAAKLIFLVKPNGTTQMKTIAEAPNGAVREGNKDEVGCVQAEKQADLQVASNTAKEIEKRLAYAFMLNSAVQRDGERVTAEEIRFMANELDSGQGGLYSLLSQEFQLPLVKRIMFQMERDKRLPVLPSKLVKPTVVTGLEALGRGNDLEKLDQLVEGVAEVFGPGAVQKWIDPTEYMTRRATALGIDTERLIKSPEQVQQEEQQQMLQSAAMQAVPHGAKALGDIATHSAKVANPEQPQGQPAAAPAGAGG